MHERTRRKAAPTAIAILLAVSSMGCSGLDQQLDRIPYFKILHISDTNDSQLMVGGNDYLYSNISVEIVDNARDTSVEGHGMESHMDNLTYYLLINFNYTAFNLTVEVWDGAIGYLYEGTIEFSMEEHEPVYTEFTPENDEGKQHSSPWKKFLEEI